MASFEENGPTDEAPSAVTPLASPATGPDAPAKAARPAAPRKTAPDPTEVSSRRTLKAADTVRKVASPAAEQDGGTAVRDAEKADREAAMAAARATREAARAEDAAADAAAAEAAERDAARQAEKQAAAAERAAEKQAAAAEKEAAAAKRAAEKAAADAERREARLSVQAERAAAKEADRADKDAARAAAKATADAERVAARAAADAERLAAKDAKAAAKEAAAAERAAAKEAAAAERAAAKEAAATERAAAKEAAKAERAAAKEAAKAKKAAARAARKPKRDLRPNPFPVVTAADWERPAEAATTLFKRAEFTAAEAIDWYLRHKRSRKRASRLLRALAILLVAAGMLVPLLAPVVPQLHAEYGFALFGAAAACVAFDHFFGLSSGWMRDVVTAQALHSRLEALRFDWAAECARSALTTRRTMDEVERQLTLLRDFSDEIVGLTSAETAEWMAEFRLNLATARQRLARPQVRRGGAHASERTG